MTKSQKVKILIKAIGLLEIGKEHCMCLAIHEVLISVGGDCDFPVLEDYGIKREWMDKSLHRSHTRKTKHSMLWYNTGKDAAMAMRIKHLRRAIKNLKAKR